MRHPLRQFAARLARSAPSLRAAACALAAAATLAACSMASSTLVDQARHMSCRADGGTYYLSRTVVKVVVHQRDDLKSATETGGYVLERVEGRATQDRRYAYCLDFLHAATSDDTLIVARNSDLLLTTISSKADDRSADIAKNIIRAIFVGISEDPDFGSNRALTSRIGSTKVFEVEFDPFDAEQTALANNALREFGFCVLVENEQFLAQGRTAASYCDKPALGRRAVERTIMASGADRPGLAPQSFSQGVFYRARLPYNLLVYVKKNRQVAGGWNLRGSTSVPFENDAPVFSVGVDRTYFAKRETTLIFDEGVLQDASIVKESELKGFMEIPLTIAQSVAALPASILQVRIDNTNNRHKLIAAQNALLESHLKYLQSVSVYKDVSGRATAIPASTGYSPPTNDRSLQTDARNLPGGAPTFSAEVCLRDCAKDPASAGFCPQYCQCMTGCSASGDQTSCNRYCGGMLGKTN